MTDKALPADSLIRTNLAENKYSTHFVQVPENVEYEDLFHPAYWRHNANAHPTSMVRVRRVDAEYDVFLVIKAQIAGGLMMEWHSGRPPIGVDPYAVAAEALEDFMKLKMAPIDMNSQSVIKIDHTPKTDWRVIGLGKEIVEAHIKTKVEAERKLASYLATIHMRLPTEQELKEHADARLAAQKKGQAA